jgi:hypothetical protein
MFWFGDDDALFESSSAGNEDCDQEGLRSVKRSVDGMEG